MAITVTTTAQSHRIVDVTYVTARLGLASSDSTNIGDILDEVSDAFDNYLGRTLAFQGYSETVPGYGEHRLRLSNFPVKSTTVSVTYQQPTSTASTSISSTEYDVDYEAGMLYNSTSWKWTASIRGEIDRDYYPASEDESYTVTYSAGYSLPSSGSTSSSGFDLPLDIRSAALRTFQLWWGDLYGGSTSLKRFRTDDLEIENHSPSNEALLLGYGDLPDAVQGILDRYKMPNW